MNPEEHTNVEGHAGHSVGIKVLVDFTPDEAQRVTELAELAGVPLTQYLKRLVADAAAARVH